MRKRRVLYLTLCLLVCLSIVLSQARAVEYTSSDTLPVGSITTLKTESGSTSQTHQLYPSIRLKDNWTFDVSGTPVTVDYSNALSYTGWFYREGGNLYKFNGCVYTAEDVHIEQGTELEMACALTASFYRGSDCGHIVNTGTIGIKTNESGEKYIINTSSWRWYSPAGALYSCAGYFPEGNYSQEKVITKDTKWYAPYDWVEHRKSDVPAPACCLGTSNYADDTWLEYRGYPVYLVDIPAKYVWNFSPVNISVITFIFNNGESNKTQSVINNDKVVEPTKPTKEFYTFKGWRKVS